MIVIGQPLEEDRIVDHQPTLELDMILNWQTIQKGGNWRTFGKPRFCGTRVAVSTFELILCGVARDRLRSQKHDLVYTS